MKMGWIGYDDTWDSFEEAFTRHEEAKILPPVAELKKEKSLG